MTISELVESCNIVDYISQYVDLKQKNGEWWGLSPFKSERTPSFSVNEEKNVFYDYSSGKGGNVLNFIMYYKNCEFKAALEALKQFLGVKDEITFIKSETFASMRKFKPKCRKETVIERKILPDNYMDRFQKRRIELWEAEGILPEIIDKYDVRYDPDSDAIVFPIYDNLGSFVNVKGRRVSPDAKELGLSKYFHYFKAGQVDYLFGLYQKQSEILTSGEIILFEGEKSVMKMDGWGYENSVAIGTSHLNDYQIKILLQLGVNVVIALDKDKNPCYNKEVQLLKRFCNVYIVLDKWGLLGEKDSPVDRGKEIWEELYRRRFSL